MGENGYAFGSVDELGDGYGFRKVRQALGVEAFGVNVIVMPPRYDGFFHYHDEQDELYFVHAGTARVEVGGEERLLGPGGIVHVRSTTPRRVSNGGDDDLVVLVVGAKGGYVGRDGQLVDQADAERRASFGSGSA
jgi:mannose-6-phosphate isomerase-like protein (cupin superfamily)